MAMTEASDRSAAGAVDDFAAISGVQIDPISFCGE